MEGGGGVLLLDLFSLIPLGSWGEDLEGIMNVLIESLNNVYMQIIQLRRIYVI